MKRVACLYRVSTKKQVDAGDDIPMQKIECRSFIDKMGWTLVNEYYEKGVSGYKVASDDRDVIQQIKLDASEKRFDVLLLYMFDRLGRRETDTPFLMQDFSKLGIELWSTQEGEQKFDNHVDKLMNYIRFWQSSGESEKTAMRVTTKHKQLVDEGIYRGGQIPFGYKIVESDRINRKGEQTSELAIDEEKAEIVKEIYSLVYDKGLGSVRIQNVLVEKNYLSPTGKKWSRPTIQNILTNPIYMGFFTFGKNSDGKRQDKELWNLSPIKREDLAIIPENIWYKVQEIRTSKSPANRKHHEDKMIGTCSPLLLIGFIKCGHCKSQIATTYNYARWTRASDNQKCVSKKTIYRCTGKLDKRIKCDGQSTYNRNKIEKIVIKQTKKFIKELQSVNLAKEIKQFESANISHIDKKVNELKKQKENLYTELKLLNDEVLKILKGESSFTPEMINQIKQDKEKEIMKVQDDIDLIMVEQKQKNLDLDDIKFMQQYVATWETKFDNGDIDEKRMLLSKVIDMVYVYRDKIEVDFKIMFKNFTQNNDKNYIVNESVGRAIDTKTMQLFKIFEKNVVIEFDKIA